MEITIRPCRLTDLEALRSIGIETYDESFRAMNSAETMAQYLEESFHVKKVEAELNNPACHFYFLEGGQSLAGYLKLNEAPAQSDVNDAESLEIERIYIRQAFKGQGLGRRLMSFALEQAEALSKKYVWLGVWDQNVDALAFYGKMGFEEAGRHSFRMGEELQNDLILKKQVPSAH